MTNVLTLRLDAPSQATFERLRQLYFPPGRNQIAAHVTLFHTLPNAAWIEAHLETSARSRRVFPVEVTGVRSLGKGVAYRLEAADLQSLHRDLSGLFAEELSAQDRQRFQPHIVVQNKVTPEQARNLLATLERKFAPWTVDAVGLDLWHYLGGPWQLARTFLFAPAE